MNNELHNLEPFFGSWHMVELIGEGSFGKVYKIKRDTFGEVQYSALKVIKIPQNDTELKQAYNEGMDDISVTLYFESIVKNVASEINMMVRFKGTTNIVSYEDHQIIPNENGIGAAILIRMELLHSLNDIINNTTLGVNDVLHLGNDICKALEKCNANHVIHRDIKPENIFVNDDGDYKIGDFGIARQLEKTMSGLSKKGTYTYMAPEVYLGKAYNSSVDIYSLGIVMYRLLNNNRTPFLPAYPAPISFNEKNDAQNKRMAGAVIPVPVNADNRLAQIILKACAFNPADRFESPTQMREALMQLNMSHAKAVLPTKPIEPVTAPPIAPPIAPLIVTPPAADEKTESVFAVPAGAAANAGWSANMPGTPPQTTNNEKTESIYGYTQGLTSEGTTVSPFDMTGGFTIQSQNNISAVNPQNSLPVNVQPMQPSAGVNYSQTAVYNANIGMQKPEKEQKKKPWKVLSICVALVLILTVAIVVYKNLSPENFATTQSETQSSDNLTRGNLAGNLANNGLVVQYENWIYYSNMHDGNKLYKIYADGTSRTKLNENASMFINVVDNWIYYSGNSDGADLNYIFKIKTDGTELTKIKEQNAGIMTYLSVVDDWIYYIDIIGEERNIYRMRTDGTSQTELSEALNPFYVCVADEWIYYIGLLPNDPDKNLIYKIRVDGTENTKLVSADTFGLFLSGNWLYYFEKVIISDNDRWSICKIRTDGTGESKFGLNGEIGAMTVLGDWIYYYCYIDVENKTYFYKIRTNGTEQTVLNEFDYNTMSTINITEDWVYYFEGANLDELTMNRIRMDGSEKEIFEE